MAISTCVGTSKSQKKVLNPMELESKAVVTTQHGHGGGNSSPIQELYVILTT